MGDNSYTFAYFLFNKLEKIKFNLLEKSYFYEIPFLKTLWNTTIKLLNLYTYGF